MVSWFFGILAGFMQKQIGGLLSSLHSVHWAVELVHEP